MGGREWVGKGGRVRAGRACACWRLFSVQIAGKNARPEFPGFEEGIMDRAFMAVFNYLKKKGTGWKLLPLLWKLLHFPTAAYAQLSLERR